MGSDWWDPSKTHTEGNQETNEVSYSTVSKLPKIATLNGTTYYMLNGIKCSMVIHNAWYYMLNGTTCYMVLHVTW